MLAVRLLLATVLAGLAAGCAVRDPPAPAIPAACTAPPPFEPAQAKPRIVAAAESEWRRWGERVVHLRGDRWLIEVAGGPWEHEREAFRLLAPYWCAATAGRDHWRLAAEDAGGAALTDARGDLSAAAYRALRIGHAPFADAWSAAFVSWVMQSAGVPREEFARDPAHWTYVTAIIARAERLQAEGAGDRAGFVPHEPQRYAPQPGDLVCATRAGPPLAHYSQLRERFRFMHCDIVVAVGERCPEARSRRCLAGIGGNVAQAVARVLIPVDRRGRLAVEPAGAARVTARDWIVVLENRLDRAAAPPAAAE